MKNFELSLKNKLKEVMVYADDTTFLINGILEILEDFAKTKMTEKLTNGKKQKLLSGERAGGKAPFGYCWHGSKGRKFVSPDHDTAYIVQQIFNQYLKLGSVQCVTHWLKGNGITTQRGKPFSNMSIRTILTNRYYIGELLWNGKQFSANHEAIISKDMFAKVQAILAYNRKSNKIKNQQEA